MNEVSFLGRVFISVYCYIDNHSLHDIVGIELCTIITDIWRPQPL